MSALAREVDVERCLYDAYVHAESVVPGPEDCDDAQEFQVASTATWSTLKTLARTFMHRNEVDEREHAMMRKSALASSSDGDALSVVTGRSVRMYRAEDDWHVPKGGVHKTRVLSISWAFDGLAFVIVQPTKLSVATRVGEILFDRDISAPIAFATLAMLKEEDTYDLMSVNLLGAPALLTQRVVLIHGAIVSDTVSRTFGEGIKRVDGANWLETQRTLVVLGQKSRASTVVTTWKYFDGSDKSDAALMHLKTIDCGIDLGPRRSFFALPSATLSVSVFHDDGECLNVAITSDTGELSVVQISKSGEYATKLNFRRNVCAATWWSSVAIAIAFSNGDVVVEHVLTGTNLLGDAPECFETVADMVSAPRYVDGIRRARILLMERPNAGGWRLVSLNERTPLELVRAHMDLEEWGSALMLARQHSLDTDQIYKARWMSSPASIEGMTDWLSRVSDRPWVVVQCLIACAPQYETQRHLLVYGLKETDIQARKLQNSDDGEPEWSWWVKLRLALLGALDRADTVHEICGGGFSQNMYQTLRKSTMLDAALNAAYSNDLPSLQIICKRHSSCLASSVFQILATLPETCPVSAYDALLPWSANYVFDQDLHSSTYRQKDWAESEFYLKQLAAGESQDEALNHRAGVCQAVADVLHRENISQSWLQEATEEVCRIRQREHGLQVPSAKDMETWVIRRACEMDTLSGQITSAYQILQSAATGLKSQILIDYAFAACILEDAVMIVFVEDGLVVKTSLEEFLAGETFEKLNALLALTSEKNVTSIISGPVSDFANHVNLNSDEQVCEILQKWILSAAENQQYSLMSRVVCCFSSSKEFVDVVGGTEAFAAVVAEACLCKSDISDSSLCALVNMLNDLPDFVSCVPIARTAISRLNACQMLRLRGLNISLEALISAERNESQATDIANAFISCFVKSVENDTPSWPTLWKELLLLQSGAFHRCLTSDRILSLLVRTQLEHRSWAHAKSHIPASGTAGTVGALVGGLKELSGSVSSILSVSAAEEVICTVSAQFMQRARDIEDTYASDAQKCLELMPLNTVVSSKLAFVKALRALAVFGVRRPPKDVVDCQVALQMVLESLVRFPDSYRSPDELQSIALQLGVTDEHDQLAIVLATGLKALERDDLKACAATTIRLMRRKYAPSWELCAKLARALPLDDSSDTTRETLLAFAITHADEDIISSLLSDWQSTKARGMLKKFEKSADELGVQPLQPNVDEILAKTTDSAPTQGNARPVVNLFAHSSRFRSALDIMFGTKDDKAKEAASSVAYALGINGVHSSDEILSIIATQAILEALKSLPVEEFGTDTPPASMWPSVAILLTMRDARAVSNVIDNIASGIQKRLVLQMVLNLGTCVHAMRALRHSLSLDLLAQFPITTSRLLALVKNIESGDNVADGADVRCAKQFNSSLSSVVDAEWLAKAIPEIDAGAFTSNSADYRKRAILALAAGSSRSMRVDESLHHALQLARAYDIDEYDVYVAYSAVLASDNVHDVVQAAKTLKEKLPTFHGRNSMDIIYTTTWKSLPSHGRSGLESMCAYYDVLHACKGGCINDHSVLSTVLGLIAVACPDIDLKLFVDAHGCAAKANTGEALIAIKREACAESNRTHSYPRSMLEDLIKALNMLPDRNGALSSENVHFTAVLSILSPPAGVCRLSSAQRWARVVDSGVLDEIGEDHVTEMAKCISACMHADQNSRELMKFTSEISTSLRLKALDDLLGKLDASKLSALEDVLDVRSHLAFVDMVSTKMPKLDVHLLQILNSNSRDLYALDNIIERWTNAGATFRQISILASLAKTCELQCMKMDVDVTEIILRVLENALIHSSTQLTKVVDIVEKTLQGENDCDALADARTRAFAKLKDHVDAEDDSSTPSNRARILDLMSDIMSGDKVWSGWALSNHGEGVVHIVSMRTSALLAPFVECPTPCEENVRDDVAKCEFFLNSVLTGNCIPFSVLSQLLTMWADYAQSRPALKPCWLAIVERALLGENADAADVLSFLAEQILCTNEASSSKLLSSEDVAKVLESVQKTSHEVNTLMVTKAMLLIDVYVPDAPELAKSLDLETIMLAIYRNRIASIMMIDSVICDQVVSLVLSHDRGRDILMPHILAAVTKEKMFTLACSLALRVTTTTVEFFTNNFEGGLLVLRKQLYARARKENCIALQTMKIEQPSRLQDLILNELSSTLHTSCAAASGALEIAIVP